MSFVQSITPAIDRPGSARRMHDHHHAGHPLVAIISLLAAALGGCAHWPDSLGEAVLYAAFGPDDLTAWSKAISGALFMAVNTIVGCYNLVALARGHRRRRRASKESRPGDDDGGHAPPA